MMDNSNDYLWENVLQIRLTPYIEPAREWWKKLPDMVFDTTGTYELNGPPGFMMRFTRTAVRSPIKGIQAFPFVPTAFLQLSGVQGGVVKMIERVCMRGVKIEEFTIVEKNNLPSTYNSGQIVAFIPSELLEDSKLIGQWIYFTHYELEALVHGEIPNTVTQKALLKL
jgi:hypothetical protein